MSANRDVDPTPLLQTLPLRGGGGGGVSEGREEQGGVIAKILSLSAEQCTVGDGHVTTQPPHLTFPTLLWPLPVHQSLQMIAR
jgi:hypothetical protein